jgi:hypothetical protein
MKKIILNDKEGENYLNEVNEILKIFLDKNFQIFATS